MLEDQSEELLINKTKIFVCLRISCLLYIYKLLIQAGDLIERRIHQQKWKWISHGSPKDHNLTSMTLVLQHESSENMYSLFFTTSSGYVLEYRIPKHSGIGIRKLHHAFT